MADTVTLHSRFNRIMAIAIWVLAVVMAVSAVTSADESTLWVYPAAATLAFFGWAALWRPAVRVSDTGVGVQNVTHTVDVPWEALIMVDTRYALTLHTPSGKFTAWAAPAPGVLSSAVAGRRPDNRERRAQAGPLRPGDLLGTESGDAAMTVREEWQRRIEAGTIDTGIADTIDVQRRWSVTVIGAGIALITVTLWALAVSG
jgi:hypothetical protein